MKAIYKVLQNQALYEMSQTALKNSCVVGLIYLAFVGSGQYLHDGPKEWQRSAQLRRLNSQADLIAKKC